MANEGMSNGQESKVAKIPIGKIRENQVALRPADKESVQYQELADSVKKRGILNPILVREYEDPDNPGQVLYGLIDGLQRYNAALDAGLPEIPAQIRNMDQAEIEEVQMITNAKKVDTKPFQYAKQIERILARKPTLTVTELASSLSTTPAWIYKIVGAQRNLLEELQGSVDEGRITISNAIELSKIPKDEQMQWVERAMTTETGEFTQAVATRVKQIKEDRKKGRASDPAVFQPTAHARVWKEIKVELETHANRDSMLARHKIKTPQEAWDLAIAWASNMDPDSQAQQKMEHDARVAENEKKKQDKALERTKQKEEEARKTREELEKKVAERAAGGPTAPTPQAAAAR